MRHVLIVTIAAIALTGCNQNSVTLTNTTTEEVAKATKDSGAKLTPGEWETTVEFTAIEVTGLPKMTGDALKGREDRFKNHRYCITPEEAANPSAGLWLGGDADSGKCNIEKFSMKGGRLEQVLSCPNPDGRPGLKLAVAGDYTAESMKGTVDMDAAGFMKMKGNITSKHVGECKPGSEKK